MNWKAWGIGALNALISGGASSITAISVAPETFNFSSGLKKTALMFGVSALVSAAKWIGQHPLPGANGN